MAAGQVLESDSEEKRLLDPQATSLNKRRCCASKCPKKMDVRLCTWQAKRVNLWSKVEIHAEGSNKMLFNNK